MVDALASSLDSKVVLTVFDGTPENPTGLAVEEAAR